MTESSLIEAGAASEIIAASKKQLDEIANYCRTPKCRHRALVEYFGQSYEADNCGACDVCLGDTDDVPDAKVISQKIMSCVFRIQERYGVNYLIDVLVGSRGADILKRKHDQLSTHGILKGHTKSQLRDWIYQLVGQDLLVIDAGEFPVVKLGPNAKSVLHGDAKPRLIRTVSKSEQRKQAVQFEAAAHADMSLFEELRGIRREISQAIGKPPYIVFTDNVLLELSATRPSNESAMLRVNGMGQAKMEQFGARFLDAIREYCARKGVTHDVTWRTGEPAVARHSTGLAGARTITIPLLREMRPIEEIAATAGLAVSTVLGHLFELMQSEVIESIDVWVPIEIQKRVLAAADIVGREKLKPIFEHLQQQVSYEQIKIVLNYERQAAAPRELVQSANA
jgi:ATP-dependent DNA helicase RecQ